MRALVQLDALIAIVEERIAAQEFGTVRLAGLAPCAAVAGPVVSGNIGVAPISAAQIATHQVSTTTVSPIERFSGRV